MHIDTTPDFADNYIQMKKLIREIEVDFNESNYSDCIEKATMLSICARTLKTDLHLMLDNKHQE
jgi:hypothetical protein